MKLAMVLLCAVLFMISSAGLAYCQQVGTDTGEIKGVLIEEKTSRPVVGQTLVLWGYNPEKSKIISISVAGQTPPKAKTDDAGKFSFTSLPAGPYVITPELGPGVVLSIILSTRKPGAVEIMVKAGESVDLGVVRLRRPQ
jgi:hypothetical protein